MFKTILLLCTLYFGSAYNAKLSHDFHLSNSQLKYKSATGVLQLSVKIFIDDLETALAEKNITGLYIGTEKETEDSSLYIEDYLKEVIHIFSGEDTLSSTFIGKELSDDLSAVWCYIQYEEVTDCTDIRVTNSILTEIFDDQKNIFTFSTEVGRKDYFTFDSTDKEKTFSCE